MPVTLHATHAAPASLDTPLLAILLPADAAMSDALAPVDALLQGSLARTLTTFCMSSDTGRLTRASTTACMRSLVLKTPSGRRSFEMYKRWTFCRVMRLAASLNVVDDAMISTYGVITWRTGTLGSASV